MEAVAIVNREREREVVFVYLSLPKGSSGQIMQGLPLGERQYNYVIGATHVDNSNVKAKTMQFCPK
jgi:hypothetical protein